jgi:hypothetical protein
MSDRVFHQQVRVSERIVLRLVDGEGILIDSDGGAYFGVGSVGGRIWSLLEDDRSFEQIVQVLTQEYECSEQQCADDLLVFIDELAKRGFVILL